MRKSSLVIFNNSHSVCDLKRANELILVTMATFGIKGCSMTAVKSSYSLQACNLSNFLIFFQEISCENNKKIMKFSAAIKTLRMLGEGSIRLHDELTHDTVSSRTLQVYEVLMCFFCFQGKSCLEAEINFKKI